MIVRKYPDFCIAGRGGGWWEIEKGKIEGGEKGGHKGGGRGGDDLGLRT